MDNERTMRHATTAVAARIQVTGEPGIASVIAAILRQTRDVLLYAAEPQTSPIRPGSKPRPGTSGSAAKPVEDGGLLLSDDRATVPPGEQPLRVSSWQTGSTTAQHLLKEIGALPAPSGGTVTMRLPRGAKAPPTS